MEKPMKTLDIETENPSQTIEIESSDASVIANRNPNAVDVGRSQLTNNQQIDNNQLLLNPPRVEASERDIISPSTDI